MALAQLRALARIPVAWLAPITVAGLAVLLMPVNERYYLTLVNYDPQGDRQQFEWLYTTALMRHTSGFLCGQLIALCLGALLGRRLIRSPAPGGGNARSWLAPTVVAAAIAGMALALVNLAVTTPLAGGHTRLTMSVARVRATGLEFHPDLVHDPGFWHVLLVGLLVFPAWAMAGVGAGALVSRGLTAATALLTWALLAPTLACLLLLWTDRWIAAFAAALLSPPVGSVSSVIFTGSGDYGGTATVALLVSSCAYAAGLVFATARTLRGDVPR
jgi:hypothetical protein